MNTMATLGISSFQHANAVLKLSGINVEAKTTFNHKGEK